MRLLLAIDDSKFSEAATQAVIAQCQPQGTEVKVLNVVDLAIPIPTSDAAGFRQESLKHGQEIVQRAEQFVEKGGLQDPDSDRGGRPEVPNHRSGHAVESGANRNGITWAERGRPFSDGKRRRGRCAPRAMLCRDRSHA